MAAKKKTTTKKAPKTAAKKKAAKAPAAKTAVKKAAPKKTPAKKAPAKKAAVKKVAAKKVPAKKAPTKKAPTKKAAVTKVAAKKVPAKKAAAVKKVAPKKAAAKKKVVEPVVEEAPKLIIKKVKITAFILKQKQRLLDLRDELVDAMSGVTGEIRNAAEGSDASGSGMHQGDAGSDAYDRDFALSVLAKEQDALYEIEQALKRVERSVYGVCEMSGEKIPQARLEAIPFARLTVDCQARWEKEYGNRRFRPVGEVGFGNGAHGVEQVSESVSLDD